MRDGTKLYTVIVMKKGARNGPILLTRSPYDAQSDASAARASAIDDILPAMDKEFVDDNYIRVYQDIRGMHQSEGDFVMNRPIAGPLNKTGDRREHRRLRHHRLAGEKRAGEQRQGRRRSARPMSASPTLMARDQPAPGAEGGGAAKPDGR